MNSVKSLGVMLDCSRDAVYTKETLKDFLRCSLKWDIRMYNYTPRIRLRWKESVFRLFARQIFKI